MNGRIEALMSQYGNKGFFSRIAPTKEALAEAREKLGFPIPKQFLEYLNMYSYGGIGFEILGIGLDGHIAFLDETLEYREEGLPDNLLVVENCDEWLYCIDVESGEVVSWAPGEEPQAAYSSFDDYLEDRLDGAIENL